MDAISLGLSSLTPISPDTAMITKNGTSSLTAGNIPLTDNLGQDGSDASDLLDNPYMLELDQGSLSEAKEMQAGIVSTTDGKPSGAPLQEPEQERAYNLSLGNQEDESGQRAAYEASRVKSYEDFGRTAYKQVYLNASAGESARAATPFEVMTGLTDNLPVPLETAQAGQWAAASSQRPGSSPVPVSTDGRGSDTSGSAVGMSNLSTVAVTPGDIEGALLSDAGNVLNTIRLTSADLDVIMGLEPELRGTLLNMLGGEADRYSVNTAEIAFGTVQDNLTIPVAKDESAGGNLSRLLSQTDSAGQAFKLRQGLPVTINTFGRAEANAAGGSVPSNVGLAQPESGLTPVKIQTESAALAGSLGNLEKIRELPFALYLFGPAGDVKRREESDNDDRTMPVEPRSGQKLPQDYLKLAEAVKMAAVLHHIYHGGSGRFEQDTPWYTPYIAYAYKNGIIKQGDFDDLNAYATRAEIAYIFSGCVPKAEFPAINYLPDLPDVPKGACYSEHIYMLAKAGVFAVRESGLFYPERLMTRSDAALVIGRIATPADRKQR